MAFDLRGGYCQQSQYGPFRSKRAASQSRGEEQKLHEVEIKETGMNFEGNAAGRWTMVEQDATRVAPSELAQPLATRSHLPPASASSAGDSPDSPAKKPVDEIGEKLAAEMKVFSRVFDELMSTLDCDTPYDERVQFVMRSAADLFGVAPTWTAFYRAVLGGEGVLRKAITAGDESAQFECSDEHSKLLTMLTTLRSRDLPENDPFEPQRMITVRIPKSLHDAICDEANNLAVSVNKLCISRMLQRVDKTMIPTSTQKRRGRRPGSGSNKAAGNDEENACRINSYSITPNTQEPRGADASTNTDSIFE